MLRRLPLPPRLVGDAGGRVGAQRRAGGARGGAAVERPRAAHPPVAGAVAGDAYELVAGAAIGLAVGLAGALVLRRVALAGAGLYPIAVRRSPSPATRPACRSRTPPASSPSTCPGVVLGNARLPHRHGDPRLRRRARLARPDRAVRDARPARLARSAARADPARRWSSGSVLVLLARPLAVGRQRRCRSRCAVARAGVPVLGRAARGGARSCWPPSR